MLPFLQALTGVPEPDEPDDELTVEERLRRLERRLDRLESRLIRWGVAALVLAESLRGILEGST